MALFENFPYTNIHELNLDWIVKIAKDFLEQYTHIQQLITDGETSLINLKETGLAELQEKADNLEAALQAWYDTHSEDIAQELADALADLNTWYTTHENYLNQTLIDKTEEFNERAEAKAQDTLESIPSDYTELYNRVQNIEKNQISMYEELPNGQYDREITENSYVNPYGAIETNQGTQVQKFDTHDVDYFKIGAVNIPTANPGINNFALFDENNTIIKVISNPQPGNIINVHNANYIKMTVFTAGATGKTGIPLYKKIPETPDDIIVFNNMMGSYTNDFRYQFFTKETSSNKNCWSYDVSNINKIYIGSRRVYTYSDDWVLLRENKVVDFHITYADQYLTPVSIDTRYGDTLLVWSYAGTPPIVSAYDKITNTMAGKTAVWFGTSIPWGDSVSQESYPLMVGALLQMHIYNESVPESEMSAHYDSAVTESNPYGFVNSYQKASKDFSATQEMLNWVKAHWNDANVFPNGRPSTAPGTYDVIINGYQIKLYRYLTLLESEYIANYADTGFVGDVDYYIFNHGHNDDTVWAGNTSFEAETRKMMDLILKYNPKATIIIIGEYENKTVKGQQIDTILSRIAQDRDIPYCKLFEYLGWTQDIITFKGHWVQNTSTGKYEWSDNSTDYQMKIIDSMLPDGIHPNSASDLRGTKAIAQAIANWMQGH